MDKRPRKRKQWFMIKSVKVLGKNGIYLNIINAPYHKCIAHITLKGKNWEYFL